MLENNLLLVQDSANDAYSNRKFVQQLLLHIDEFEKTRGEDERRRHVLYPKEIESIFGVSPVNDSIIPMTESLEDLIRKLIEKNNFVRFVWGLRIRILYYTRMIKRKKYI